MPLKAYLKTFVEENDRKVAKKLYQKIAGLHCFSRSTFGAKVFYINHTERERNFSKFSSQKFVIVIIRASGRLESI